MFPFVSNISRAKHFSFVYINHRNRTKQNRTQHSRTWSWLMIKDWEINIIRFGIGRWSNIKHISINLLLICHHKIIADDDDIKMFVCHHRPVPAQILFETLFQKFPLPRSSPLFHSSSSLLNIVVAECLEMLTGMNMFNAPSFVCSVLFTRSVISIQRKYGHLVRLAHTQGARERSGHTGEACEWTNKRNKRTKWKNERASEWVRARAKRTRCAQAYFGVSTEFENATIWQLDRTVGIDKYLLLQLMYLESGW